MWGLIIDKECNAQEHGKLNKFAIDSARLH